ncbi:MAG: hypothetical protein AABY22_04275 [Nanoarchaeota archaeon]
MNEFEIGQLYYSKQSTMMLSNIYEPNQVFICIEADPLRVKLYCIKHNFKIKIHEEEFHLFEKIIQNNQFENKKFWFEKEKLNKINKPMVEYGGGTIGNEFEFDVLVFRYPEDFLRSISTGKIKQITELEFYKIYREEIKLKDI